MNHLSSGLKYVFAPKSNNFAQFFCTYVIYYVFAPKFTTFLHQIYYIFAPNFLIFCIDLILYFLHQSISLQKVNKTEILLKTLIFRQLNPEIFSHHYTKFFSMAYHDFAQKLQFHTKYLSQTYSFLQQIYYVFAPNIIYFGLGQVKAGCPQGAKSPQGLDMGFKIFQCKNVVMFGVKM